MSRDGASKLSEILTRHDYPLPVSKLLGEAIALEARIVGRIQVVDADHFPALLCEGYGVAARATAEIEETPRGSIGALIPNTEARLVDSETGEGVDMMQCTGSGELFVADLASEIQVMYLENDMISVNGANVLAFVRWSASGEALVCIVNEAFVERYVAGGQALGRAVEVRGQSFLIGGVVRNSLYNAFGEPPTPAFFFALAVG